MATHLEKANLAQDSDFLKRLSFATVRYANYILNEDPATPNHKARFAWAQNTIRNGPGIAASLSLAITNADVVDTNLGAVTDADLQGATENVINQLMFL